MSITDSGVVGVVEWCDRNLPAISRCQSASWGCSIAGTPCDALGVGLELIGGRLLYSSGGGGRSKSSLVDSMAGGGAVDGDGGSCCRPISADRR